MNSSTSEQPTPFGFAPASVYLLFKRKDDGQPRTFPGVFFHEKDNEGRLVYGDCTLEIEKDGKLEEYIFVARTKRNMNHHLNPIALYKVASPRSGTGMTFATYERVWAELDEWRKTVARDEWVRADEWMKKVVHGLYEERNALGLDWTDQEQPQEFKDLADHLTPKTQIYLQEKSAESIQNAPPVSEPNVHCPA